MDYTRTQRILKCYWARVVIFLLLFPVFVQAETRTRQDLINEFRAAVGEKDSTNTSITNADIRFWINEAQDWISTQSLPLEFDTTYEITGENLKLTFLLPQNSEKVFGVLTIDGSDGAISGALFLVPPDSFGIVDKGKGSYMAFGRNLYVHGLHLIEDDSIKVSYYGYPPPLTADADTSAIRQNNQPFILEYCIYRLLTFRNFWGNGLVQKTEIKKDLLMNRQSREVVKRTE